MHSLLQLNNSAFSFWKWLDSYSYVDGRDSNFPVYFIDSVPIFYWDQCLHLRCKCGNYVCKTWVMKRGFEPRSLMLNLNRLLGRDGTRMLLPVLHNYCEVFAVDQAFITNLENRFLTCFQIPPHISNIPFDHASIQYRLFHSKIENCSFK